MAHWDTYRTQRDARHVPTRMECLNANCCWVVEGHSDKTRLYFYRGHRTPTEDPLLPKDLVPTEDLSPKDLVHTGDPGGGQDLAVDVLHATEVHLHDKHEAHPLQPD